MGCTTRRFPQERICAGDLRHRINILLRELNTPGADDTIPPIVLTPVKTGTPCAIKTVRGTARFDGVNIEDSPTHLFIVRNDPILEMLEEGNNFISYKSRLFRLLRVNIKDEDTNYIELEATERGVDSQLAAQA